MTPEPLTREGQLQRALELAYRYLARRDRTQAEMRLHLESRGVEAAVADKALQALAEQGYVDDVRFAQRLAEDKRELEQWGRERIRQTLLARGIAAETVSAALGAERPTLELERAVALLARRFPAPPTDRLQRERALGVLIRKGYESEVALDALASYRRATDEAAGAG